MKHRSIPRSARALVVGLLLMALAHILPLVLTSDPASSLTAPIVDGTPQVSAAQKSVRSLCRRDEQTIFSCETVTGGAPKYISLCGSKRLDNERGYVQYRYGRRAQVELTFPDEKTLPRNVFRYAHYFRALVDRTELVFVNGGYKYTLYDYYEGEQKPAVEATGVRVVREDDSESKGSEIKCRGKVEGRLYLLEEIVPKDEGNALNLGN